MILGEIDLSIGATYLLAPFDLLQAGGGRDSARAVRAPGARLLHGGGLSSTGSSRRSSASVRSLPCSRHAVHAGGGDACHLACRAERVGGEEPGENDDVNQAEYGGERIRRKIEHRLPGQHYANPRSTAPTGRSRGPQQRRRPVSKRLGSMWSFEQEARQRRRTKQAALLSGNRAAALQPQPGSVAREFRSRPGAPCPRRFRSEVVDSATMTLGRIRQGNNLSIEANDKLAGSWPWGRLEPKLQEQTVVTLGAAPMFEVKPHERRRHERFEVALPGRCMLFDRLEYPCWTIDVSPSGFRHRRASERGYCCERIVAYISQIGRVEGMIARHFSKGFAFATFFATFLERDRLSIFRDHAAATGRTFAPRRSPRCFCAVWRRRSAISRRDSPTLRLRLRSARLR